MTDDVNKQTSELWSQGEVTNTGMITKIESPHKEGFKEFTAT